MSRRIGAPVGFCISMRTASSLVLAPTSTTSTAVTRMAGGVEQPASNARAMVARILEMALVAGTRAM